MKSKELREWYQSGISLYDIEILMMYDLNDSDLRGYFTLIRDKGVSVNDIDYILRHDEIGPSFQRQLLQALSTDKKQFEASLCWLEEKGILDTSKDCREDTPEEEEKIDRICEIVDEIIDSYDNYQVDFEKQYTATAFLIRLLCYNQGKELIPTLPLNGEKIINFPDYDTILSSGITAGAIPFTRLTPFDVAVLDVFYTLYCMDVKVIPVAMVDKLLSGNKGRVQSEKKIRVIEESVRKLQSINMSLTVRDRQYDSTKLLDVEVFDTLVTDGKRLPTVYYLNGINALYAYAKDFQEVADVPKEYYDTSRLPDEIAFEDTETAILLKRRVITKVMGIIRESKQKRHKFKHWNRLALEQKKDKTKGIFPDLELMPEVENLTPEEAEKAYQKWRKKEKPKYIKIVKGTLENLKANYAILDYEDYRDNPREPVNGFDIICFTKTEMEALHKMREELKPQYVQNLLKKRNDGSK